MPAPLLQQLLLPGGAGGSSGQARLPAAAAAAQPFFTPCTPQQTHRWPCSSASEPSAVAAMPSPISSGRTLLGRQQQHQVQSALASCSISPIFSRMPIAAASQAVGASVVSCQLPVTGAPGRGALLRRSHCWRSCRPQKLTVTRRLLVQDNMPPIGAALALFVDGPCQVASYSPPAPPHPTSRLSPTWLSRVLS